MITIEREIIKAKPAARFEDYSAGLAKSIIAYVSNTYVIGDTEEDTYNNIMALEQFKSGCFVSGHARDYANYIHRMLKELEEAEKYDE